MPPESIAALPRLRPTEVAAARLKRIGVIEVGSNSVRLVEVALEYGSRAGHLVDFADEIDEAWFEGVRTVGVTSGASVPEVLVRGVLELLAARGYVDVTPVIAAQATLTFSLPSEIRRDLKAAGMSDKMTHDASFSSALQ